MRKVYGSYQVPKCAFCGLQAIVKNKQNIPVCQKHKNENISTIKCVCGSYLQLKEGKYGTFFLCDNCGPMSLAKGLKI